ncbi:MAG: PD-(D/E)XK nuclease family transposase [Thiomargarita sp.]|nr:PD-(D/E)XK nuclease family transposase [Thiomargarita sp.]
MVEVIPLKYGHVFKQVFSQPEVFNQFAKDVLGIELNIQKVHTEYQYPEPIGFVRSKYDLFAEDTERRIIVEIQHVKEEDFFDRFLYYHLISLVEQVDGFDEYSFDKTVYTIVMITSVPRDGSINFSCAISDINPVDEWGNTVNVYPHRLIFLSPRQANEKTPPNIRKWLDLIADSLDGSIEENQYNESLFQQIIEKIRKRTIDPTLLAEIKDEAAWEKAAARFAREGREEGLKEGQEKGILVQKRETVIAAQKMGMEISAIATLAGLTEIEVQKLLQ